MQSKYLLSEGIAFYYALESQYCIHNRLPYQYERMAENGHFDHFTEWRHKMCSLKDL